MGSETNSTACIESDLDLVRRAQLGDSDAFASLFHAHKGRVYSVCLRLTNNTAEAEDLTQDTFLRAFRKLFVRRGYGSKDARLSGSIDRIALTQAIGELPEGYRTIFLLHEVEGYEHPEIAELLDCSVGNSKSQLHKAKLRIRELLGQARDQVREGASQAALRPRAKLHSACAF
jgi:RNA polymerase sigma-70 factor, ECF subfamily